MTDAAERLIEHARFVEQIAGDFDPIELHLPGGIVWRRQPTTGLHERLRVWLLWLAQGRPRHRAIVLTIGSVLQTGDGWHLNGWAFDGTYVRWPSAALDVDLVDGRSVIRAVCGWHLPDLARAAVAPGVWRLRKGRIW